MRVSSTQMIGRYQKQLNDSYEDQAKLMEQSDGSKLHRPSDDSVNYSKFLRYQNTDTENERKATLRLTSGQVSNLISIRQLPAKKEEE